MNHPDSKTWAAYLAGDLPESERAEASVHLKNCPECAEQLERWQDAIGRLTSWDLPRRASRARVMPAILKWAAAAAIVLGTTFGLGRMSAPQSVDRNVPRTELEPALRSGLISDLEQAIRKKWSDDLARQITASTESVTEQLREEIKQSVLAARQEDQKLIVTLIERLQTDIAANYLSLRKDLETVASLTDSEIQQAHLGLIRLAAATKPEPNLE